MKVCDIEDYKVLFSTSSSSADAVSVDAVADDTDLPIRLYSNLICLIWNQNCMCSMWQ